MNANNVLILDAFWVDNIHFPSEETPDSIIGQAFRDGYLGDARHLGWMDMIQLQEIIKKNHISHIILKHLDVLGRAAMIEGQVKVCTNYLYMHYHIIKTLPKDNDLWNCKPLYHSVLFGGWDFSEDDDKLPSRAHEYMTYLLIHTQVQSVSCSNNKVRVTVYFDENKKFHLLTESIS